MLVINTRFYWVLLFRHTVCTLLLMYIVGITCILQRVFWVVNAISVYVYSDLAAFDVVTRLLILAVLFARLCFVFPSP
jgi:hypothetical protein